MITDRDAAVDLLIDVGRLVPGPTHLRRQVWTGRYFALVPVEDAAKLALAAEHHAREAADLHEVNQDLRRQRDEARDRYNVLLALFGFEPAYP